MLNGAPQPRDSRAGRAPGPSRREFLKLAGAAGAAGAIPLLVRAEAAHASLPGSPPRSGSPGPSIYERMLGVRPVINAAGPLTRVGASLMPPEVTAAMAEASGYFVDLHALDRAAGARIAAIMDTEAAMVTSGAFGAMVLAAAACLAGDDPARMAALPAPTWPRRECLIQRAHQFVYDRAYTAAGMKLVSVDTAEEMMAAAGERTAMIAGLANVEKWDRPGVLMPAELVEIGRRAGVPVFLDAAGEVPPASNLTRWTRMGVDLVAISGGKGLRGPSSTGILAGRADLIESARAQASPNTAIGRGMKVDKEEVIGLLVALERFLVLDHEAELARQWTQVDYMKDRLADIPGLSLGRDDKQGPGLVLSWSADRIPLEYREFGRRLEAGEPPVVAWTFPILAFSGEPTFYASSLEPGQETVVARRARDVLLNAI